MVDAASIHAFIHPPYSHVLWTGLATVFALANCTAEREFARLSFVSAVLREFRLCRSKGAHAHQRREEGDKSCEGSDRSQCDTPLLKEVEDVISPRPQHVAIVDDNVTQQKLYPEMLVFQNVCGVSFFVVIV